MADFTVPADWTYDGSKDGLQSRFRVSGHSTAENYLVIFDRKLSEQTNGSFSKPGYRVRIIRSFVDGDGNPLLSKAVVDTNISWPNAAPAASVKAMCALLGEIFSDAELASDIVDDQIIPLSA